MAKFGLINPKTQTPASVYAGLLILGATVVMFTIVVVVIIAILFALMIDANLWFTAFIGVIIGTLGGLFSLGFLVPYVTAEVPAYVGRVMTNQWTKSQRVLFQGLNPTLLWETPEKEVDLQAEVKEVVGKEGNTETYPTADGRITAKYTYTIGPDLWEKNGVEPGACLMQWASFKIDTIQTTGRARFSRALSDFVKTMPTEEVIAMGKVAINEAAFPPDAFSEFEKEHGAVCEVVLEDVDRDPALQKARDVVAQTKSYDDAIRILMQRGPNGEAGMSREKAEEYVELANFPNVQKIKLNVEGLENLTHFSGVIPGVGSFGTKTEGGDKKNKGGKK